MAYKMKQKQGKVKHTSIEVYSDDGNSATKKVTKLFNTKKVRAVTYSDNTDNFGTASIYDVWYEDKK